MPQATPPRSIPVDWEYFAICGLGSLDRHCVNALTEFGKTNLEISNIMGFMLPIKV